MSYINGAVIAVPSENKTQYIEHSKVANAIFKSHGALQVVDCWGADVKDGEMTSFIKAVQCRTDESVVFSWIMWPSKEAGEKGMQAAMQDERWVDFGKPPFDSKRMIFGGFDVIVE